MNSDISRVNRFTLRFTDVIIDAAYSEEFTDG
jgi:hypothetical protein